VFLADVLSVSITASYFSCCELLSGQHSGSIHEHND